MQGYAIDVSHHQNPATLPWKSFEGHVDAVIVRASYGAELRDKHAPEHVRRAREIGAKVGLYHFFRSIHTVQKQFDVFRAVADQVGLQDGDIVPALDIEDDPFPSPGVKANPSWSGPAQELCERLRDAYTDCVIYTSQKDWSMLGKPDWLLERPLWVPFWNNVAKPASPGNKEPFMWQHRVGPFVPNGPAGYDKTRPELDQNRILGALPLIARKPPESFLLVETENESDDGWDDLRDQLTLLWHPLEHVEQVVGRAGANVRDADKERVT